MARAAQACKQVQDGHADPGVPWPTGLAASESARFLRDSENMPLTPLPSTYIHVSHTRVGEKLSMLHLLKPHVNWWGHPFTFFSQSRNLRAAAMTCWGQDAGDSSCTRGEEPQSPTLLSALSLSKAEEVRHSLWPRVGFNPGLLGGSFGILLFMSSFLKLPPPPRPPHLDGASWDSMEKKARKDC